MEIIKKLNEKQDIYGKKPVTIAFLGDSVTQGCFECYIKNDGGIETVFDYKSAYSTRVREILNLLYPNVQINIINSGISGDGSTFGYERIERDILPYSPDLTVVSFGLNDCCAGLDALEKYIDNIKNIIEKIKASGSEVVFLTQNFMNTEVSCHLKDEALINVAKNTMQKQNEGTLKTFMESASNIARECGAKVCNLYSVWEKISVNGVNVTDLLANKINHPVREIHYYMAIKLIETFFEI